MGIGRPKTKNPQPSVNVTPIAKINGLFNSRALSSLTGVQSKQTARKRNTTQKRKLIGGG